MNEIETDGMRLPRMRDEPEPFESNLDGGVKYQGVRQKHKHTRTHSHMQSPMVGWESNSLWHVWAHKPYAWDALFRLHHSYVPCISLCYIFWRKIISISRLSTDILRSLLLRFTASCDSFRFCYFVYSILERDNGKRTCEREGEGERAGGRKKEITLATVFYG